MWESLLSYFTLWIPLLKWCDVDSGPTIFIAVKEPASGKWIPLEFLACQSNQNIGHAWEQKWRTFIKDSNSFYDIDEFSLFRWMTIFQLVKALIEDKIFITGQRSLLCQVREDECFIFQIFYLIHHSSKHTALLLNYAYLLR